MTEKVSTGGRPGFDRIEMGKKFVEWARDNPEALTVPMFTTLHGFSSDTFFTWAKEDRGFRQYYLVGKELIGINRLRSTMSDEDRKLTQHIYLKTLYHFDMDCKMDDREEKRFEAELKADNSAVDTSIEDGLNKLMGQLSRLQSDRKSASINSSEESKS